MATDPYRSGGAEYGAPQYAPQPPSMRPVGSQPGATPAPAYAQEAWGASPAAVAPAFVPPDPLTVHFSRPYKAHGDDVQSITFRKVTPGDLRKVGYPIRNIITPGQGVTALEEVPEVICKYITILATPALPPSTVNALDMDDFTKCRDVIMSFFL